MTAASLLLAALVAAPAATPQITLEPVEAPAGSVVPFVLRVTNERRSASIVKVVLRLPQGLASVRFQPKPGWKRTVTTVNRTTAVAWEGGKIAPGEFDEFALRATAPAEQQILGFPATQTYSNGEVVAWTGAADSETPEPRVTLTEALEAADPATTSTTPVRGRGRDALTLVLAIAGLAAGLAGIGIALAARRRTA